MGGALGKAPPPNEDDTIVIYSDKSRNEAKSNFIKTSKYRAWTFLPLNLWGQFQRTQNRYFAMNMIIALVPGVSPISPASAILPFVGVLAVAAIKDGMEDWNRHKDDKKWNSLPGKEGPNGEHLSGVFKDGKVDSTVPSADITTGDIIKIVKGETIRADVLLLSSSDDVEHQCFIETMQLDGETNAKLRQAAQLPVGTQSLNLTRDLVTEEAFRGAELKCECVLPSANLHEWSGSLTYKGDSRGVTIDQFLFRGAKLVNTKWVWGMVVYAGMETKIQKNNKPKVPKAAALDVKLNHMIKIIFVIQQLVILLMCALATADQVDGKKDAADEWYRWYHITYYEDGTVFFWRWMTYFILVSFAIPISLFVTIEITKSCQAMLMSWDNNMRCVLYDANDNPIKEAECYPRTSDLNEQLAIVRYIFSDKTGTLTENRMAFHTGEIGKPEAADTGGAGFNFNYDASDNDPELRQFLETHRAYHPPKALVGRQPSNAENVLWYLLSLALCHELSIDVDDEVTEEELKSRKTMYQGASPDEVALAKAAQSCGVEFIARTSSSLTVKILGREYTYRILDLLPFTSKRKMMSIVLQGPCVPEGGNLVNTPDTTRFCLTKGADSVMMSLCAGAVTVEQDVSGHSKYVRKAGRIEDPWYSDHYYPRLDGELSKLGTLGLRTLVLAYRPLPDDVFFEKWHEEYSEARKVVGTEKRDAAMEECWARMENDYYVIGATAIEDRLQDQVPETVGYLIRAGIVIWMLTGDKQETAESIAGTAHLVDKQTWQLSYLSAAMPNAHLDDVTCNKDERDARQSCREAWLCGLADPQAKATPSFVNQSDRTRDAYAAGRSIGKGTFLDLATREVDAAIAKGQKCALITDGGTLGIIIPPLEGIERQEAVDAVESMWAKFIELSQKVNSGILCRLTPAQKGHIVKAFQQTTGETALAVGDGSNDVPMITESYVGIGIMGLEGSQAVLASDYAIPRFKHLRRLMMVHGRYALYRNSLCIFFSFYKNICLSLIQIFFSFLCRFSGQTLFDSWLLTFQNAAFTSIPPLFVGIFEKDVDESMAENIPSLFTELREGLYGDRRAFAVWFGAAFVHAGLIFGLVYSTVANDDTGSQDGRTTDLLSHGAIILTCQIFTVLTKLSLHIRCWTWLQLCGIVLSFFFYLIFLVTYSSIPLLFGSESAFYKSGYYIMEDGKFWLWIIFFAFGVIGCLDLPLLCLQKQFFPTRRDLCQRLAEKRQSIRVHVRSSAST